MEPHALIPFGLAFLLGVGVGAAVKWPLRGGLAGAGFLLIAYALLSPQGAMALGMEALQWAVGSALGALGYPPEWARYVFTPEGENVLRRLVSDAWNALYSLAGQTDPTKYVALAQALLTRLDIGFLMGILAGIRR